MQTYNEFINDAIDIEEFEDRELILLDESVNHLDDNK